MLLEVMKLKELATLKQEAADDVRGCVKHGMRELA